MERDATAADGFYLGTPDATRDRLSFRRILPALRCDATLRVRRVDADEADAPEACEGDLLLFALRAAGRFAAGKVIDPAPGEPVVVLVHGGVAVRAAIGRRQTLALALDVMRENQLLVDTLAGASPDLPPAVAC